MSRAVKDSMVQEYATRFSSMEDCVLLQFDRLSARDAEGLRARLRAAGSGLLVLRNSLAALAFKKAGLAELGASLAGSAALAAPGDGVTIVKTLQAWSGQQKGKITVRGGALGRKALGAAEVEALGALPDLKTMRSQVLATVLAPATQVLALVQATLTAVPNLVSDHIRKQEAAGAPAA